jgi:nucleoporin NUP159
MAFSFGTSSPKPMTGGAAGGAGGLSQGRDLELINTEVCSSHTCNSWWLIAHAGLREPLTNPSSQGLGFLSIAGDAKVRLTPEWSPNPAATASLLSIASRQGLAAVGGPDGLYIATTEAVRKAFETKKEGDSEVRPFHAQAKVPLSQRISQVAFTADEKYLAISAETGGGLAVYNVAQLLSGSTQSAFELSTNSEPLRSLVPNPMSESAGLCALVTTNGNLLMANLTERSLVSGPNGTVLRSQVSCTTWSTKGKQLIAGMADGSIQQMTPDGVEKGLVPKSPNLGGDFHSTLPWHRPPSGASAPLYESS